MKYKEAQLLVDVYSINNKDVEKFRGIVMTLKHTDHCMYIKKNKHFNIKITRLSGDNFAVGLYDLKDKFKSIGTSVEMFKKLVCFEYTNGCTPVYLRTLHVGKPLKVLNYENTRFENREFNKTAK